MLNIFGQTLTAYLTLLHRKRGITSSGLMTMFWLLYTALSIPQFLFEIRGYQKRPTSILHFSGLSFADYQFVSFSIHFLLLVFVLSFHLFADRIPVGSRFSNKNKGKQCPELHASFVSRMFYFWYDPVIWKSYRKPVTDEDMFDIRPEDLSENINPCFEKFWELEVERKSKKANADGLKKAESRSYNTNVKTFILYLSMCF